MMPFRGCGVARVQNRVGLSKLVFVLCGGAFAEAEKRVWNSGPDPPGVCVLKYDSFYKIFRGVLNLVVGVSQGC